MRLVPYKFTDRGTNKEPVNAISILFHKLMNNQTLTRVEKNRVVDLLYGSGGQAHHSGNYRVSGWTFPFYVYLTRYIVRRYGSWFVYYAPDKTSLKSCTYLRPMDEIHEIPHLKTI